MKRLFSCLEQALVHHQNVVLVTIIASSGSTPRGAGARMLVSAKGLLAGTIGGGAVEHRCIGMAQEVLGDPHPIQTSFSLNQGDKAGLGMICGGELGVHFLPISSEDLHVLSLCRDAAERFSAGFPLWLLTPLQQGASLTLFPAAEHAGAVAPIDQLPLDPRVIKRAGQDWFCEQIQRPGAVYLFGGGHIAQALVPVLAPLDFPSVVLEDRAEFADPALFPAARSVQLIDFSNISAHLTITNEDYLCIMTRGHQNDLLIQHQALRTPARYIGLIGSAKKSAAACASLRKMGFSEPALARIVTPIGLPIGGRSPAEIAISIAAQLIEYRAALRRDFPALEDLL